MCNMARLSGVLLPHLLNVHISAKLELHPTLVSVEEDICVHYLFFLELMQDWLFKFP